MGWGVAQCATTALAGAVPRPCVRGARGRFGGLRPVPASVSLPFPPSRPACPALRVAGLPVRVSLTLARWYAIPRGLCVAPARSGCPSGSPRVPFACVCARAPVACAPPPPWVVWRAHLARSRHWALVGPFHVVRAPPRVLPWSLAPSGVLGGGRSGPGSSLPGLALCAPRGAGLWRMLCGGCVPRGWRGAVPGGGGLPPLSGASGVRRCPSPGRPSSGAGSQGSATRVSRVRTVRAWGPSTSPTACALAGRRCSLWGWRKGVPGGGAFHHCEGLLVSGAVPPPTTCPLERVAGVPRPVCPGCGRCGRGDPAPAPQRAPLRAGAARCEGGGRASPGGCPPPL